MPALLASLDQASESARLAAADVLEALDEPRARAALERLTGDAQAAVAQRALEALGESAHADAALACAARLGAGPERVRVAAARALVRLYAAGVIEALEPLVACLFASRPGPSALHQATLEVLTHLPAAEAAALRQRLDTTGRPHSGLAEPRDTWAEELATHGVEAIPRVLAQRARRRASDDDALVAALAALGPVAIPALHRALEALADGARAEVDDAQHAAAACVHRSLAALHSRLALYDLRERLERTPERYLPDLIQVAHDVGDAQVALALVRRCARQPTLVRPCAAAFAAIAAREQLTRRQALWRGLHGPGEAEALRALWPARGPARRQRDAQ